MTTEELQQIVENIESIKFLLDERDLDSQALQVELAGLHEIIVRIMDESAACALDTSLSFTRAMLAKIEYKARLCRDEILKQIAVRN